VDEGFHDTANMDRCTAAFGILQADQCGTIDLPSVGSGQIKRDSRYGGWPWLGQKGRQRSRNARPGMCNTSAEAALSPAMQHPDGAISVRRSSGMPGTKVRFFSI